MKTAAGFRPVTVRSVNKARDMETDMETDMVAVTGEATEVDARPTRP